MPTVYGVNTTLEYLFYVLHFAAKDRPASCDEAG